LYGQGRVSAQVEVILVHGDRFEAQNLLPNEDELGGYVINNHGSRRMFRYSVVSFAAHSSLPLTKSMK
jgi:hypothetical protein